MRGVAGEIDHKAYEIVRDAAVLHRDARVDRVLALPATLRSRGRTPLRAERGAAVPARRDRIDPDLFRSVFRSDLPREADDAGLRGGVADRHRGKAREIAAQAHDRA